MNGVKLVDSTVKIFYVFCLVIIVIDESVVKIPNSNYGIMLQVFWSSVIRPTHIYNFIWKEKRNNITDRLNIRIFCQYSYFDTVYLSLFYFFPPTLFQKIMKSICQSFPSMAHNFYFLKFRRRTYIIYPRLILL